jgi:DNA-directed RNA polymerase subunit RPC12/RpoP
LFNRARVPARAEPQGRTAMPEESYFCPHCNSRIKKSAQAYIMGESMTTKGAHFIALGGMPDSRRCPSCGHDIDYKKMIMGEYDARSGKSSRGGAVRFVVLAGVVALVVYFIWFR